MDANLRINLLTLSLYKCVRENKWVNINLMPEMNNSQSELAPYTGLISKATGQDGVDTLNVQGCPLVL